FEQVTEPLVDTGLVRGAPGQRVLHHAKPCGLAEIAAQLLDLRDGQPAVLGQNGAVRALELFLELGDRRVLVGPGHAASFRLPGGQTTLARPVGRSMGTGPIDQKTPRRRRTRGVQARRGGQAEALVSPTQAARTDRDLRSPRHEMTTGGLRHRPEYVHARRLNKSANARGDRAAGRGMVPPGGCGRQAPGRPPPRFRIISEKSVTWLAGGSAMFTGLPKSRYVMVMSRTPLAVCCDFMAILRGSCWSSTHRSNFMSSMPSCP